jgi:hypothetical protein
MPNVRNYGIHMEARRGLAQPSRQKISREPKAPKSKSRKKVKSRNKRGHLLEEFYKLRAKKTAKEQKPDPMRAWQLSYLHAVIDAEIRQTLVPNPSRRWKEKFAQIVSRYGSLTAWAAAQPEYKAIRKKKLKTSIGLHGGAEAGVK